jgi:hypothetical protein
MIATFAVSLLLIGLSGFMLDWHRRSWRSAQQEPAATEGDRRFARSQYRRRMQASGIIGVLGAAIGIGPLVPHEPLAMAIYVAALGGACACIMVLAAMDAWATRQNFVRLEMEQLAAQLRMARDLACDSNSRTDNPVRHETN